MVGSGTATEEFVQVAGGRVQLWKGGSGEPLLILHRDVGHPGWLPFHEQLARRFTLYIPAHPGYDKSERPTWARNVRDLAALEAWLLKDLGLSGIPVVGLGFGGWIAAEMATFCPHIFRRMVLVSPMGVQPREGEILDQFLVHEVDYVRMGFHDPARFVEVYGAEPDLDQLETWDLNREMTTRVAWKPYMFNQALPHLLGGVEAPTLLVWGSDDRIVPRDCAARYAEALPNARLEIIAEAGHCVDIDQPDALARLVLDFVA